MVDVHTISSNEYSEAALADYVEGLQPFHSPLYIRLRDNEIFAITGYDSGEHEGTYDVYVGGIVNFEGHDHNLSLSTNVNAKGLEEIGLRMIAIAAVGDAAFRDASMIWAASGVFPKPFTGDGISLTSHISDCAYDDKAIPPIGLRALQDEIE